MRRIHNFGEIQWAAKPKMSPAHFAILSRTCLREHLISEVHANRHMESFDSYDSVFPEDAQSAPVERRSGIL